MSHFTAVNTAITNVNILKESLKACGLRVAIGEKIRGYNGTLSDTTFEIVGCHDVMQQDLGFTYIAAHGEYNVTFHSETKVGELMTQIVQDYAMRSAHKQSRDVRGLAGASVNVLVHSR